jgi:hypothetical protein
MQENIPEANEEEFENKIISLLHYYQNNKQGDAKEAIENFIKELMDAGKFNTAKKAVAIDQDIFLAAYENQKQEILNFLEDKFNMLLDTDKEDFFRENEQAIIHIIESLYNEGEHEKLLDFKKKTDDPALFNSSTENYRYLQKIFESIKYAAIYREIHYQNTDGLLQNLALYTINADDLNTIIFTLIQHESLEDLKYFIDLLNSDKTKIGSLYQEILISLESFNRNDYKYDKLKLFETILFHPDLKNLLDEIFDTSTLLGKIYKKDQTIITIIKEYADIENNYKLKLFKAILRHPHSKELLQEIFDSTTLLGRIYEKDQSLIAIIKKHLNTENILNPVDQNGLFEAITDEKLPPAKIAAYLEQALDPETLLGSLFSEYNYHRNFEKSIELNKKILDKLEELTLINTEPSIGKKERYAKLIYNYGIFFGTPQNNFSSPKPSSEEILSETKEASRKPS